MISQSSNAQPATAWDALYDGFVEHLRALGVGNGAPKIGDRMDDVVLPDSAGRHVQLSELHRDGPLVLSFMRGGWCPYCRSELKAWHDAIPRLAAVGGRFVAVSGEIGGRAEQTRCSLAPASVMLCDVDHGFALSLGLAFPLSPAVHRAMDESGLKLSDVYGDSGWVLPVPATFVIDRGGVIRYAFVEADFRHRANPAVVIAVVEALG